MTDANPGTPRIDDRILQNIEDTIENSVLGGNDVYIQNPFDDLLKKVPEGERREKSDWRPSGGNYSVNGDGCPYLPGRVDLTNENNKREFVGTGKGKFEKNKRFWGVCNDFSWICTSILATRNIGTGGNRQGSLLPPSCRVEWYGWKGITNDDHAFTVVNRVEGSNNADWGTWGIDCFVVDQWYALQTHTSPVKVLHNTASKFYDDVFLEWWREMLSKEFPTTNRHGDRVIARSTLRPLAEFKSQSYP